MNKEELTEREKSLLKEHLPYELDQLDAAYVVAVSPATTVFDKRRRLMAIDCFYMHARNLIEFYLGSEVDPDKTRVHARRFTEHPQTYPKFEQYIDSINDQVTHLQLNRGRHAEMALNTGVMTGIKGKLDSALQTFQRDLTDEAKKHWKWRAVYNFIVSIDDYQSACTEIYAAMTSVLSLTVDSHGPANHASWAHEDRHYGYD